MVQVLRQQTNSSSAPGTVDDGAEIRRQLTERLAISGYSSANDVGFKYCEGVVVLRGHVVVPREATRAGKWHGKWMVSKSSSID